VNIRFRNNVEKFRNNVGISLILFRSIVPKGKNGGGCSNHHQNQGANFVPWKAKIGWTSHVQPMRIFRREFYIPIQTRAKWCGSLRPAPRSSGEIRPLKYFYVIIFYLYHVSFSSLQTPSYDFHLHRILELSVITILRSFQVRAWEVCMFPY